MHGVSGYGERPRGGGELCKRDANIELLRCLLMFLIVSHHCYLHGIFYGNSEWWSVLFLGAIAWHVDCFVAISGWFGINFTWKKFRNLWGQILFYSALSIAYGFYVGKPSIKVYAGWFGGTYLFLMCLAPLLNAACEKLCERTGKEVISTWGLFAFAYTATWIPWHFFTGLEARGAGPFSLTALVFMYVTVRLVKLRFPNFNARLLRLGALFGFAGIVGSSALIGIVKTLRHKAMTGDDLSLYSTYNAPYIWCMAIVILVIFARYVKVPERLGRVIRFISPSMFGIYLMHDTTAFGHQIFILPEQYFSCFGFHPTAIIMICAVFTFVVCLLIDLARRGFLRIISHLCPKL